MKMSGHYCNDWCHLCGKRQDELVDIWYPRNAEHAGPNVQYIRICGECGEAIRRVSKKGD